MDRQKKASIRRLMGSLQEMSKQDVSPLQALMNRADPYADARDETQVDVWEGNGPVEVVETEDGEYVERTTQTARTPRGEEEHALNGKTVFSELIPKTDDSESA